MLEHTANALHVLQNMHNALRRGGILVFSERWYDRKWHEYYRALAAPHNVTAPSKPFWDVGHPINIKRAVVDSLLHQYTPLFERTFSLEGDYPNDEGVYFIGRRK